MIARSFPIFENVAIRFRQFVVNFKNWRDFNEKSKFAKFFTKNWIKNFHATTNSNNSKKSSSNKQNTTIKNKWWFEKCRFWSNCGFDERVSRIKWHRDLVLSNASSEWSLKRAPGSSVLSKCLLLKVQCWLSIEPSFKMKPGPKSWSFWRPLKVKQNLKINTITSV